MDKRLTGLQTWLEGTLAGVRFSLEPASEDASFRRYFRVLTREHSLIAMDAPPDKEDCGPFIKVARELARCGTHVPQIIEADLKRGYLLMTDLGDQLYLQALRERTDVRPLYEDALRTLVGFQAGAQSADLPPYDRQLLETEMGLFRDWLLARHLNIQLDRAERAHLAGSFSFLVGNAQAQPSVFVHRDYHSRNLMVCPGNNPGVLDFQDAVRGPVTYDLVSMLKDCYISLPPDQVSAYLDFYLRQAADAGIETGGGREGFLAWFELMGVQRHLKASGIFARLWLRDGKRGFLADIPRTLSYISDCADRYPELAFLARLIGERILPALDAKAAPAA